MASPIVAGLCGLMLSKNPALTPAQVESCLKGSYSDALASGSHTISSGNGRINAYKALVCAQALGIKDETTAQNNVNIYPNPSSGLVSLYYGSLALNSTNVEVYNAFGQRINPIVIFNNSLLTIDLSNQSNGAYYLNINTDKGKIVKKMVLIK